MAEKYTSFIMDVRTSSGINLLRLIGGKEDELY